MTIEQGTSRPKTLEVGGSHEGSSGVVGGTVPATIVGQRKRPQPQSRPKQMVKKNKRKIPPAEEMEEREEDEVQDQLKMEAVISASKLMELEEMLKETRLHLEQQMNLVNNQKDEIGQLRHQLANEVRVQSIIQSRRMRP